MSQLGFAFDLNKCVGCQSCQIACSIENDLGNDLSWRQINTYNPDQINTLPHYHLSLACNHCQEPVCLYQCPAKAITKNIDNGIVIIDENKCIGCKFCSWVCPYDAPIYNPTKNLMTKCTLCNHRVEENLEPACVSICPTDALNISRESEFTNPNSVPGFPESNIKPCIKIETLKPDNQLPEQYTLPYSNDIIENYSKNKSKPKNKISIENDWTLIIFTLLISILGAWLSRAVFNNNSLNPLLFLATGFLGMVLSTLHLGKKFRAYRAILNLKTSWLSREVLFFSLFLLLALFYSFDVGSKLVGFVALAFGYLAAISADHVYYAIARTEKRFFHSAQVWLTILFLVCFFNQVLWGVYVFGFIKTTLYMYDKFVTKTNYLALFFRLTSFIAAIIFLIQSMIPFSFILIIFSELLDRIEFYYNLKVITPQNHLYTQFHKDIKTV